MTVLVLPPRIAPDSLALEAAALAEGWDVERIANWRALECLRGKEVAVYGDFLFAEVIADTLALALLEPHLDWLAKLAEKYRLRRVEYTTLGKARLAPGPVFIKPAEDKCFPAAVYPEGAELPCDSATLADVTPVLISEPVQWDVEYRCFVHERRVASLSPYCRAGERLCCEPGKFDPETSAGSPEELDAALSFASRLLGDDTVAVPPAFVMDIGRIHNRGWAVVEANSIFGANLFGCSPRLVLNVIRRACPPTSQLSPADKAWVRSRR